MLRVIVELHDANTGEVSELSSMVVFNVGGTKELGNYRVVVDPDEPQHSEHRRKGRVEQHPRLTEPVWSLVARALKSVGFEP
jgi:hypothetical protein